MRATGMLKGNLQPVCHVSFGVSPLDDRIYVDSLEVQPEFRRQGFASALLKTVATHASPEGQVLALTPLHEVWASHGFWNGLRSGNVPGLMVTRDVRVSEMAEEASRWRRAATELGK